MEFSSLGPKLTVSLTTSFTFNIEAIELSRNLEINIQIKNSRDIVGVTL